VTIGIGEIKVHFAACGLFFGPLFYFDQNMISKRKMHQGLLGLQEALF
jgi:hypothetical protein